MAEYPVVFTINDVVSGNGFLAGVSMNGRALMVQEDGAWWTLGVRPAAIAESDSTPLESYGKFRQALKLYLVDAATASKTFEQFKAEVERFFDERDEAEETRWVAARQAITDGKVELEPPFTGFKREAEPRPATLSIERLDKPAQAFTPANNVNAIDSVALAEAA